MRTIKITNTQSCSYCYGWGERFFTQDDCVWAVINGRSCIVESKLRKQSLLFVILYRSGWRRLCQLAWELDLAYAEPMFRLHSSTRRPTGGLCAVCVCVI